jgi:hypothetical protein
LQYKNSVGIGIIVCKYSKFSNVMLPKKLRKFHEDILHH